jgi:hypothetical protein
MKRDCKLDEGRILNIPKLIHANAVRRHLSKRMTFPHRSGGFMSQDEYKPRPSPIQPRNPVPGQDPMINPGYQPVPRDLPPANKPDQTGSGNARERKP